ncbi:hypothetical protein NQ317_013880, partial [Molorchus minor]
MADPKYADLPGINNEKIRTGYDSRSGDWELAGQGSKESPVQKYQRLQCEMKELLEEISELKNSKNEEEINCLVSTEQVEQSLKMLADLKLEETLGEEVVSQISNPQGAQIQKLLSQIEQYKASINDKPESQSVSDESGLVYQFNYNPNQAKLMETQRIAELESRVHQLESILGASSDKLSRLTTATSKGSLMEAAEHLSATASLLDSAQLDHIEGRLGALAQKLESISEKKAQLHQDEDKDKMILELYELVKNSESISELLPQTISRLKALEALHNK